MEPKHFESLYPVTTRETELNEIVRFIREGNSCQLIGMPGVGRSVILSLLTHNKDIRIKHFPKTNPYIHMVLTDFSEARGRPLKDVMKLLFLSLGDSLRERNMRKEYEFVNGILRESLSLQDELVLTQGLKRAVDYLSIEKKLTLIFLCDRFEEYVPSVTSEFFATLRLLRNRAKYRFAVVFSTQRPLEDIIDAAIFTDFYEFIAGHRVYVKLHDPVSVEFRLSYLQKMIDKKLSKEDRERILSLTGGHGRLTRLASESLLTHDPSQQDELKEYLLQNPTIRNGLLEIWKSLTPLEQEVLEGGTGDDQAREYVTAVGLLQDGACSIPLLATFMERSKRITHTEKQPIVFDEVTNTIRKGELVLSDNLTKAEYRLLKYLIQHPDQVVERDEIISVVWKDSATTQGVTDQAVDQLVFRVRRKIEDNLTTPEHLTTVKGRGFKFSP